MRWLTFLAGVATGLLLNSSMGRSGVAAGQQARPGARSGSSGNPGGGGARSQTLANVADLDGARYLPPRTDEQVRERILSQIRRTISNPDAIQVDVEGGCVTLRGQVQARDSVLLMAEVESTSGVVSVRNHLNIQGSLDEIARR